MQIGYARGSTDDQDTLRAGQMRTWLLSSRLLIVWLALQSPLVSQSNAHVAQWQNLRKTLEGASGRQYFQEFVKDCLLPPLEGTLVSSRSVANADEFLIAIRDDKIPEAKLRLKRHLQTSLPSGTPIIFEGVAREFTSDPFVIVFDVETVNRAAR